MNSRPAFLVLTVLLTTFAYASEEDVLLGKWLTDQGKAHVEITKEGDTYTGKIVWLADPNYPADDPEPGKPRHDRNNPDSTKRGQPIIGLVILRDFKYAGGNSWRKGTIYDPETGKTYKSNITLAKDGSLKVRGFVGISLIGETTVWTRL
jgi:uncharacterized protein (DUF2147 family)